MSAIAASHIRPGSLASGQRRPTAQAAARPAPRSQVRLTQRGRLVVFLAALGLLLGAAVLLGAGSVATERPGTPEPTRVVTVGPGDTLWALASDVAADGEVRAMVDRIERLNALESADLQVGQKLRIPLSD